MAETKMDAQYFIDKFEAIPENRWCIGDYERKIGDNVCHCALGHCGATVIINTAESLSLIEVLENHPYSVSFINDNLYDHGDTPKQRILTALYDIKDGTYV